LTNSRATCCGDGDAIFGNDFKEEVRDMGIEEELSTPHWPWQRAWVERVIGPIRRECLDHVIVFHESSLRRNLASYFDYYQAHIKSVVLKIFEVLASQRE
jgi:Integrase core domain